jgi:hypothetical protein
MNFKLLVLCLVFVASHASVLTGLSQPLGTLKVEVLKAEVSTGNNVTLTVNQPFILRQSLGTTDTKNNVFWTVLYELESQSYLLVGYDTQGNNKTIPLSFIPIAFIVGLGQFLNYDPNTGNLWFGYFDPSGVQLVGSLDLSTNTFTKLATIESNIGLIWPTTAFDPQNKVLVTQYAYEGGIFTIGFDTTSGKVLYNVSFDSLSFEPFDYDSNSGFLYGFSYEGISPVSKFVTSVDPVSGKVLSSTEVQFAGLVSNVVVDQQNKQLVGMIDLSNSSKSQRSVMKPERTVYTSKRTGKQQQLVVLPSLTNSVVVCEKECYQEPILKEENQYFNLVAFDLATAKVASSAPFCEILISQNQTVWTCPLTIGRVLPK